MTKQEFLECIVGYLPYGLECEVVHDTKEIEIGKVMAIYNDGTFCFDNIVESDKGFFEVKPKLKPLPSLTDKELIDFNFCVLPKTFPDPKEVGVYSYEFVKWCYKNHFDIHGLIDKGLAEEIK